MIERVADTRILAPRIHGASPTELACGACGNTPGSVVVRRLRGDGVNPGYFGPDSFTFGAPLHRLTLEVVVGAVPGLGRGWLSRRRR